MEQAITSFEAELAELDKKTDEQITFEANFFANQHVVSGIEFGKRLIVMKKRKQHGEWYNWLEKNFNLSERMANNYIRIANRYGNRNLGSDLNQSQLIALLALPEGTEQTFLKEMDEKGTPFKDMTKRQSTAAVKDWKAEYEAEKAKVENLFADNGRLQAKFDAADKLANKYHVERDILQKKLENQKPITIEPADYQQLKKARVQLQNKIDALQKELQNKTVEVVTPADYDATKKELARLQAEQSEMVQRMEVFQNLSTIATLIEYVIKSPSNAGIQDFKREHPEEFGKMCAAFLDFTDSFYKE